MRPEDRHAGPHLCRGQRVADLHATDFRNLVLSGMGKGASGLPHPMTTAAATGRKRGLRCSEGGATAVEAAFVLSILVGMVLVIVDFAQAFFIWNTLQLVVGQASRSVIVQTSIPNPPGSALADCPPAGSATSCAKSALTTLLPGASSSCTGAPTSGQYCVSASCTTATCSLSALYGFKFVGTYTLAGQITVPVGLPPD
jgi:Flp pilus assembly protein TadG